MKILDLTLERLFYKCDLAGHAVQIFPELSKLQLGRCWGALRILTPDTKPIYVESEICPGPLL
ncbi:MAG: hypothetical protein Ct9H300mP28_29840 [Pseudomonadota bacterium]|nr:MAG: hypothetical protein Ct9H300mP28_29840 [Pseudomonadota bacterium]